MDEESIRKVLGAIGGGSLGVRGGKVSGLTVGTPSRHSLVHCSNGSSRLRSLTHIPAWEGCQRPFEYIFM